MVRKQLAKLVKARPRQWAEIKETLWPLFEIQDGEGLQKREMLPGESVHIPPKTIHRMTAIEDSDILEVSTPELHDVVRLEDRYGRETT